jgi:hypothetical protein
MRHFFLYLFLFVYLSAGAQGQLRLGVSSGVHWTFRQWYVKPLNSDLGFRPAPAGRFTAVLDWPVDKVLGIRAEGGFQDYRNLLEVFIEDTSLPSPLQGYISDRLRAWTGSVLLTVRPFRFKGLYFEGGLASAYLTESLFKPIGALRKSLKNSEAYEVRSTDLPNHQRYQVLADVGVGLSLPVGKRMSFLSEVRYQYGLWELDNVETTTARLSALGVNIGLMYTLNDNL